MSFYRLDRINLSRKIAEHAHYVTGRTLDVGAGNAKRYHFPAATEYVRMNTSLAQDQPGGPKTDLIGRAEEIPAADTAFDSIVCTQTLMDIFDAHKAFREFARVLKPSGTLLLTNSFIFERADNPHFTLGTENNDYHYWSVTDSALERLSLESGLTPIVVEPCGGFYSAMYLLAFRYLLRRYSPEASRLAPLYGLVSKCVGSVCNRLDRKNRHDAGTRFTDNWILVARKHAS
jgi:SAM-dependent methyltransferase